jgi:hypothetical protein
MINFKQFLEAQEPQGTPIIQRAVPLGAISNGGGWKIHLRTGKNDTHRSICYNHVLDIIKANGNKWDSKMLKGGEADQKDITIYCGPKREAIKAAIAIINNEELYNGLRPPGTEILQDDILLHKDIPNIYGRFEASRLNTAPFEFHQYGCKGWSMLVNDVQKKLSAGFKMSGSKNSSNNNSWTEVDKENACKKAFRALTFLFGKDFTGAGEYGQTGDYEEYVQMSKL